MDIYETMTCSKCKRTYKGHFIVDDLGNILCSNCKKKEKLPIIPKIKVLKGLEAQLQEDQEVLSRFYLDLVELYPPLNIDTDTFITDDGSFNAEKVYYMGNSLIFCFNMQGMAYECLAYLYSGKKEYQDFCNDCINFYLKLRSELVTKKEQDNWSKQCDSEILKYIKLENM